MDSKRESNLKEKIIEVVNVSRRIGQGSGYVDVLANVDFYARRGEVVSVIGPSGCGKSTFLDILAGLERPDSGTVTVHGLHTENLLGSVGYMQQKDLLLPWRTVMNNVILGLEMQGISKKIARRQATERMHSFGLSGFEDQYPYALSGGMRQRAAFLRTILTDTSVLLLDEPFSALDALNRSHMQEWLLNLLESYDDKTVVLVTHDVEEALFLSDRIYVMSPRPGRIEVVEQMEWDRPRSRSLFSTQQCADTKSRILSYLLASEAVL